MDADQPETMGKEAPYPAPRQKTRNSFEESHDPERSESDEAQEEIDPDMIKLLRAVGYKPDDPIGNSTMTFINDFVEVNGGMEAFKEEMAGQISPHKSPALTRGAKSETAAVPKRSHGRGIQSVQSEARVQPAGPSHRPKKKGKETPRLQESKEQSRSRSGREVSRTNPSSKPKSTQASPDAPVQPSYSSAGVRAGRPHRSTAGVHRKSSELEQGVEQMKIDSSRLKCMECTEEAGIVFLECRHMVACDQCALKMQVCPICKWIITSRICY